MTINSSTIGSAIGGEADTQGGNATATGNSVAINSSTLDSVFGGNADTQGGNATASGNSVTISNNSTVNVEVFGGAADVTGDGNATASGNSVTINNSTAWYVYGGNSEADGAGNSTASNNTVTINNSTVNTQLDGGWAENLNTGNATASGNSVTINNSTVSGYVVGGRANAFGGNATATYNTVTIGGASDLSGANLYGGRGSSTPGGTLDVFTGNTLNVYNYSGSGTIQSVQNFEFLNFVFPTSQSGPVLTVTNATLGNATAGKGSTITASTIGGPDPLQPGASVTLIQGPVTDGLASTQATGQHGATLAYAWTLEIASLNATLGNVQAAPQAQTLSKGNTVHLTITGIGSNFW